MEEKFKDETGRELFINWIFGALKILSILYKVQDRQPLDMTKEAINGFKNKRLVTKLNVK